MSFRLDRPRGCESCGSLIPTGALADGYKLHGEWRYTHVNAPDGCPSDASAPVAPKKRAVTDNFLTLECSNTPCSYAVGVAIRRRDLTGPPPAECWLCGSPWAWTSDEGWLEVAA